MLQVNPYFRPTTTELLQHHVFDDMRTKTELQSRSKIVIDVDENEYKQSYSGAKSSQEEKDREIMVMKTNIIKDYVKLNKSGGGSYHIGFISGE